jgi:glycosyltransferase involved in cell wall biosynthesis
MMIATPPEPILGPLVSILTPSYQQARWLGDNLDSVARQTYPHIEHIVMDGGSTDGSRELLESRSSARLLWRSEADRGQSHAINKALAASAGEIIGWLNSDDAYFGPQVVEAAVRVFADRPDVDVVYGHAALVNAAGAVIQLAWAPPYSPGLLRVHDFICQPTAFVRRSAVHRTLVDETFHYAMDYELWLRLARTSKFARLDRILAVDRHQLLRKSYTLLDAVRRDRKVLQARYGIAGTSGTSRIARKLVKIGLRLLGATLIPEAVRDSPLLGWSIDGPRQLLRRQLLMRRGAMPVDSTSVGDS